MSPRPRTLSDTDILNAATHVVSRHGPGRLTLANVAEAVGLAPATLIQRFGSKRGLLLAIAQHGVTELKRLFSEASVDTPSPLATLRTRLTDMVRSLDTPEAIANHLAFLHLDLTEPSYHEAALAHSRALHQGIRAHLEAAAKVGELGSAQKGTRLGTEHLANLVQATFNGALITWAVRQEGTLADWLRTHLDALLAPYQRAAPRSSEDAPQQ